MVAICFNKKIKNFVHLETYTSHKEFLQTHKLKLPLDSYIVYCIQKFCNSNFVFIQFIPVRLPPEEQKPSVTLVQGVGEEFKFLLNDYEVPWTVALCEYPVIMAEDIIISGLCAVARQICYLKNYYILREEHEDGLLGFRHTCLQAPKEVSVWTKFCEIEIIRAVQELLTNEDIKEVPDDLIRFEEHMKQPVKIHNVFKVAQTIQRESAMAEKKAAAERQSLNAKLQEIDKAQGNSEYQINAKPKEFADEQDPEEREEATRTPKLRKWKSNKNKDPPTLDGVRHEFAEGPYLTLADLVLLPPYHVIIQSIGETRFESLLPCTYKWYKNLITITRIKEIFMTLMSEFDLKQLPFENMTMAEDYKDYDVSLYKCDPKRYNPQRKCYTKESYIEQALSYIRKGMELELSENEYQPMFEWKDIPEHANPFYGILPDTRVQRKSEQLQNLALPVLKMATDGDVIVDFCCGTGHLGILLAYLLPRCTIILLENKVNSLMRAWERGNKMKLKNIYYYQCNLDFFIGEFDIGIGLHACGTATDLILEKCLKQNARFVISPCCYGAIHGSNRIEYPRSKMFSHVPLEDYLSIAHAADQTHHDHPKSVRGARCMTIIDSDRARLAEEFDYTITIMSLKPITCTPKNNLIIGISTEK